MAKVAKLSGEVATLITSYVKAGEAKAKKDAKLLDILQAEGIESRMLVAPKEGQDRTLFDGIKVAVIAGFDAGKRKLLDMPTKGMSETQKKAKFKVQQSVGGWMGTLKRDLAKREGKEESDGASTKSTFESRLKRDLTKYIAQIEKLEGAQFTVTKMLDYLRNASALIK